MLYASIIKRMYKISAKLFNTEDFLLDAVQQEHYFDN